MLKCAECNCINEYCNNLNSNDCIYCAKEVCCCIEFHLNDTGTKQHILLFFAIVRTFFATSLGVYRFWRDIGFVFGAIGIGILADLFGLNIAIHLVAFLALASGVFVLTVMKETGKKESCK